MTQLYKINVKPDVDFIHAYDVSEQSPVYLGLMDPAEDYTTMILKQGDVKTFTVIISVKTKKLKLNLVGYGKIGGTTEYKIQDLLSVPVCKTSLDSLKSENKYISPIIINTPNQIRDVMVQIPPQLQKLLNLGKWYQPISIDKDTLKSSYKYQPSEFAARGIDITGKSWFSQCVVQPAEWCWNDTDEFLKILNDQLPVVIHCFSNSLITVIDTIGN